MKAVINTRPWLKDPLAVRKRWSEDEYNLADHGSGKSLCFAIMFDDNFIVPHPPIIRGMEMVKKALEDAGHKGEVNYECRYQYGWIKQTSDQLETIKAPWNMSMLGMLITWYSLVNETNLCSGKYGVLDLKRTTMLSVEGQVNLGLELWQLVIVPMAR